jgi:hypothetical protein
MARQANLHSSRSARIRTRSAWICALAASAFALGTPGVAAADHRAEKRRTTYRYYADACERHHDHSRHHVGPHQRGRRIGHFGRWASSGYRDGRYLSQSRHAASHRYYCDACRHDFRSQHALHRHVRRHHHVPTRHLFDHIAYRVGFGFVYHH